MLAHHAGTHHHRRHGDRLELQLDHLRHHVVRVGGLRRGLRPADAPVPVLEAHDISGRDRRYGRGRRNGLLLEARSEAPRRDVRHL